MGTESTAYLYIPLGGYAGGQLVKVRADDGIHLTHAGGRRLAAIVLYEMARRRP